MEWYGSSMRKGVEMVFCDDPNSRVYRVMEYETGRMPHYRTFKSYDEYVDYSNDKERVRKSYKVYHAAVIVDSVRQQEERKQARKDWIVMARKFVERWGAQRVPDGMRDSIDRMLEEDSGGYYWLQWPPIDRNMYRNEVLEKVKVNNIVEANTWPGVTAKDDGNQKEAAAAPSGESNAYLGWN
jgi:hypothetical protein